MPGWVPTGNLNTPRDTHTATKLPNGTVLVHGGRTFTADPLSTIFLNTSELFAPGTGTWAPTGTAFYERTQHSATLLRNGKVLVVGGFVQARVVHLPPNQPPWGYGTELYDPATGRWENAAPLNFPREYPAVTPLSDGRVLAAGGSDPTGENPAVPRTAEIFDPVTQGWVPTGDLVFGRSLFTATLLTSGLVLVVGGVSFYDEAAQTCELYEPAAGRWRLAGVLGRYRLGHTATRLNDGTVLVAGGVHYTTSGDQNGSIADTEIYDPTTEVWSFVGPLNMARSGHTATLLPNGSVLVVGGAGGSGALNSTELYDPATQTWTLADDLNTARSGHTPILWPPRRGSTQFAVMFAGGRDSHPNSLNSAELFSGPPIIRR